MQKKNAKIASANNQLKDFIERHRWLIEDAKENKKLLHPRFQVLWNETYSWLKDTKEAIEAYRKHPDHQAVAAKIEAMEEHGIGVDFETNEAVERIKNKVRNSASS